MFVPRLVCAAYSDQIQHWDLMLQDAGRISRKFVGADRENSGFPPNQRHATAFPRHCHWARSGPDGSRSYRPNY
jgi:hypothetical protein